MLPVEAKGKSHYLLKAGSKRRRTKVEIAEEKEEEALRQEGLDRQSQQVIDLQQRLQQMEEEKTEDTGAANLIRTWI